MIKFIVDIIQKLCIVSYMNVLFLKWEADLFGKKKSGSGILLSNIYIF